MQLACLLLLLMLQCIVLSNGYSIEDKRLFRNFVHQSQQNRPLKPKKSHRRDNDGHENVNFKQRQHHYNYLKPVHDDHPGRYGKYFDKNSKRPSHQQQYHRQVNDYGKYFDKSYEGNGEYSNKNDYRQLLDQPRQYTKQDILKQAAYFGIDSYDEKKAILKAANENYLFVEEKGPASYSDDVSSYTDDYELKKFLGNLNLMDADDIKDDKDSYNDADFYLDFGSKKKPLKKHIKNQYLDEHFAVDDKTKRRLEKEEEEIIKRQILEEDKRNRLEEEKKAKEQEKELLKRELRRFT